MPTHLQQITTLAKKLRKEKPGLKWTDAIKKASSQLNSIGYSGARKAGFKRQTKKIQSLEKKGVPHNKAVKKVVGAVKKKAVKLPVQKIVTTVTKQKVGNITLPQVGVQLTTLENKIVAAKAKLKAAKYVADKKIIRYEILILNRQFKALKAYLNTIARFK